MTSLVAVAACGSVPPVFCDPTAKPPQFCPDGKPCPQCGQVQCACTSPPAVAFSCDSVAHFCKQDPTGNYTNLTSCGNACRPATTTMTWHVSTTSNPLNLPQSGAFAEDTMIKNAPQGPYERGLWRNGEAEPNLWDSACVKSLDNTTIFALACREGEEAWTGPKVPNSPGQCSTVHTPPGSVVINVTCCTYPE
eukprot:SAG31_NODE_6345_length_2055_cov_1.034765_3_plen_193_part_00